ncbi:unnamed protein product [Camellia sinensis]
MASSAIHHLLFLPFLPFLPVFSASNITLGLSISAIGDNSSWISPSEEFAFGFRQLDNTNIFLLAIWYAKIPDKTIIWHANTTSQVQTESKVELTASGLTLNSPNGQAIWKAPLPLDTTISYATMLDTGNFVLSSSTNNSVYAWQSFSYPTDTILPTQVLSQGGMLYSRLTETNYSNGRLELRFMNGALELKAVAWTSRLAYKAYYSMKGNGSTVELSWPNNVPNYANNYHRATSDFDGVFKQYFYSKTAVGTQSWSVVRHIPENICIQPTNIPSCQCPLWFLFTDPNNKFGGCQPNFRIGCRVDDGSRKPEDLYNLTVILNVNWPSEDSDSLQPYNQTQCEQSCLHDCSCTVAIFDGNITCWKKRLPLSNGRKEGAIAIIKTRKGIGVPSLGFKEELGMGSFGIVYKGALKFGSKNQVAVKRLDKLSKGEREFKTEVSAIGKTHHTKIVQLVGYCDEGPQRLLVYELMTNESLANFLFSLPRPSWYQRTQVARGIARGLVYLHEECDAPIIHCDIKPQNMLIDEYFTTRISDIGLAKSLMFNQSRTHIGIRGTRGYVAPEWFK